MSRPERAAESPDDAAGAADDAAPDRDEAGDVGRGEAPGGDGSGATASAAAAVERPHEARSAALPAQEKLLPARLTPFAPPDPASERRTAERLRQMTFAQLRSRRDRIDKRLFELGLSVGEPALAVPSVRGTGLVDLDRILRKIDALDMAGDQARLEREADRPESGLLRSVGHELSWLGEVFRSREIRARRGLLVSELGLALCSADQRVLSEYAPHVERLLAEHVPTARRVDELFVEMRLVDEEFDRRAREGLTGDSPREIDALLARAMDSVDEVSSKVGDTLVGLSKTAARSAARGSGQAVWGITRGAARGAWALGSRSVGGGRGEGGSRDGRGGGEEAARAPVELADGGARSAPGPAGSAAEVPALIRQLAGLRDEGILSEAEFARKKKDLLDRL